MGADASNRRLACRPVLNGAVVGRSHQIRTISSIISLATNRFIGDYLTEEVLSRQSEEVRNFILDMSIVRRFSAPLCEYMTGQRQSARILRDLQYTNLFLIPLDAQDHWFRFHHLFGAVARNALETEQPDRIAMLHGRAAKWLSENGYVDAAIEHALAAR